MAPFGPLPSFWPRALRTVVFVSVGGVFVLNLQDLATLSGEGDSIYLLSSPFRKRRCRSAN